MILIQYLLLLFFLVAIALLLIRFQKKEIRLANMIFWLLFWLIAIAIVIFPDSTFYFSKIVGIGRGADLVVYLSLAVLFYLVFRVFLRIEKMEMNLTKVVRKKALDKVEKNN